MGTRCLVCGVRGWISSEIISGEASREDGLEKRVEEGRGGEVSVAAAEMQQVLESVKEMLPWSSRWCDTKVQTGFGKTIQEPC